jgi:Arc/MetJ-type ribon-helix-helix transcriptional regulator
MREKVEEGVFASRSHAVEYAVRQLMRGMESLKILFPNIRHL